MNTVSADGRFLFIYKTVSCRINCYINWVGAGPRAIFHHTPLFVPAGHFTWRTGNIQIWHKKMWCFQMHSKIKRFSLHKNARLQMHHPHPASTKNKKKHVIITSKCFDVIITCLLRCVFLGRFLSIILATFPSRPLGTNFSDFNYDKAIIILQHWC